MQDERDPNYRLWVYDIESAVDYKMTERTLNFATDGIDFKLDGEGKVITCENYAMEHKPNLIIFKSVFEDDAEEVLFGEDCLERFLQYMLAVNNGRNILIAHNSSGYDARLILDAAVKLDASIKINTVRRGLKFMELKLNNLIFRDSLLFLPSSLSMLAKSFSLPVQKGIFPHMFNRVENYDYEGIKLINNRGFTSTKIF